MPNVGDKVKLTDVNYIRYFGVFAGYGPVTENYIIEDCYSKGYPNDKSKRFFNRRYVVMIELL